MKAIEKAVDKYRQLILDAERHIWKTPETGFKEKLGFVSFLLKNFLKLNIV